MNQPKINVSLDQTQKIVCENCGHDVFVEGVMVQKASKFLTGTEKDALIPIPVFSCSKCHHVNEEFRPKTN